MIHISKRTDFTLFKGKAEWLNHYVGWGVRLIAVFLSLVVSGLLIFFVTKLNPVKVYGAMIDGVFGTPRLTWAWVRDFTLLLLIAVGLAPAFKMRFWNIGAEGQVLVGGIVAAAFMIHLGSAGIPAALLIIMMAICSMAAGAVWGVVPALFKAKWNTNETLFTLMMNYIAIQLTSFLVPKWEHPKGSNSVGIINPDSNVGWFPKLFEKPISGMTQGAPFTRFLTAGEPVFLNVMIVAAVVLFMFFYLKKSKHGYEIAVVGQSENTARYAAMNVKKIIIRSMTLSGALCGLAGFMAVSGIDHTISTGTAGGRGFTAIIVAWLAKFNPFIMILISGLLVFLEKGSVSIASEFGLSKDVSHIITGIILFFILGSEFFINYEIKFARRARKEA
ncbi:MAG: ABC transporter permease [Clostridiales bacterium]|nr:ABC transporter permease [Clostridiales bacterium]